MTSKQRQNALVHTGLIMTAEAIYNYSLDKEGDNYEILGLLYDLRSLLYNIDSMENVVWVEDVVKNGKCWCELSTPCHLRYGKFSKVTISFDGVDNGRYMIGTVSLTVDSEEVLNGIRYVEV